MQKIKLGLTDLMVPNVSLGMMRLQRKSKEEAKNIIQTALDLGINFFDHADIYGIKEHGGSEKDFGIAFKELGIPRDEVILQSKVGIVRGEFNGKTGTYFDFSKEHILKTVDESLARLQTDYLDILLLHRNDALFEPEKIAEAFNQLHASGKVRYFGVSNHTPMQIELLKKFIEQDLVANQLEFSAAHSSLVNFGFNVNRINNEGVDRTNSLLEYSRLHDMTVQAWSPVQSSMGVFLNNPAYSDLNATLEEVGANHGIDHEATAIAWLLRHPVSMQVILGTMTPERIRNYASASEVQITRQEWYEIYRATGNNLP